jgi:hypothetical protein
VNEQPDVDDSRKAIRIPPAARAMGNDQEVAHMEPVKFKRRPQLEYLPRKAQLLASIKDLRRRSATKKLEYSKRLVEKSRRIIFETELKLTKRD